MAHHQGRPATHQCALRTKGAVGRLVAGLATVAVFVTAVVQVGGDPADAAGTDIEIEVSGADSIVITLDGDLQSGQLGSDIVEQCVPVDEQLTTSPGQQYVCFGNQPPTDLSLDVTGLDRGDPEWNAALGWIVDEANDVLPVLYDIPVDERLDAYGRAEVSAYVKDRLVGIIDKEVFQVPLTEPEQRAYDYVVDKLIDDDAELAQAAYDEYVAFRADPCTYSVPRAPGYIDDPVEMPSDVRQSCEFVQSTLASAFDVVPPFPTVEQFQTWGAYRTGFDKNLTTNEEQELADRTGEAVQATALGLGIAGAVSAAGISAMLVGTGTGVSSVAVGLIGSQLAIHGGAYSLAGVLTPAIGAATVGSVIGVVVFAVIVLGIVIWKTIEREQVGQTLAARLQEARSDLEPLGMAALQAKWAGQPFAEYGDDLPIHYDGDVNLRLLELVVEGANVLPGGDLVHEPESLWTPNGTGTGDHRFRYLDGPKAGQVVNSIHIDQDGSDLDVRFDRGWMIVTEEDGAGPGVASVSADLAFTYEDPSGQLLRVMRAPAIPEQPDGGFIVLPFDDTDVSPGELRDELVIDDGTGIRRIEIVMPGTLVPGDVYPAAIGALRAGNTVALRPNPVNESGAFEIDAFTSGYDFDWTVEHFDTDTSTWVEVHTGTDYSTGFVPSEVGDYRATVTMEEAVAVPSPAVSGEVTFVVSAPAVVVDELTLVDDGYESVYLDLQLGEMASFDTIDVTIQWPGEIGSDVPGPVTGMGVVCAGFAGPHLCNTNPSADWSGAPALNFEPGPLTDLGQGAIVTLENSYGSVSTHHLEFAGDQRPEILAPAAIDRLIEFSSAESHVQRVIGDSGSVTIARVEPDVGDPIGLGLYDPVNDTHGSSFLVIGSDSLRVGLVERPGGDWELTLSGTADPDDVGNHAIPVVVQQTDAGGAARAAHVINLDVVPAADDAFRAALVNEIPAPGVLVDDVPDLPAILLGGPTDEVYTGDICVSFYRAAFPPTAEQCSDVATFFGPGGSPRRFPFERMLPTGIAANSIHRATIRAANDELADTRSLTVSFRIPTGPPEVPVIDWSPGDSEVSVTVTPSDPSRPIVDVVCTVDDAPAPDCVDAPGGTIDLGDFFNGSREFRVVSFDGIGNYSSQTATIEVTGGVVPTPGPPTAVGATARVGGARLTWTAPTTVGASPIDGYRIQASTDGGSSWTTVVADTGTTATSRTVSGLAAGTPIVFRVAALNADGRGAYSTKSASVTPTGSTPPAFSPIAPQRLVETRDVVGFDTIDGRFEGDGPLVAGEVLEVQVAGRGDVPVDASAVVVNATVTNTAGFGFVTFFPCGPEVPQASNVNYGPGATVANTVVVKLSSSGSLCVFSLAGTDLIVDVNAFLPEPSSATPIAPQRLVETRDVVGFDTIDGRFEGDGPLVAGEVLEVQVAGRGDVPVDASAVVVNATVTNTAGFGFVTFFPCGPEVPQASNVNYGPGATVANTVVVKLSSSGSLCVFSLAGTDLIVDVNAYTR